MPPHIRVRHYEYLAGIGWNILRCLADNAALHNRGITPLRRFDAKRGHTLQPASSWLSASCPYCRAISAGVFPSVVLRWGSAPAARSLATISLLPCPAAECSGEMVARLLAAGADPHRK